MNKILVFSILGLLLVGSVSAYVFTYKDGSQISLPNYIKLDKDSSNFEIYMSYFLSSKLYGQDKENGMTDEQIYNKVNWINNLTE